MARAWTEMQRKAIDTRDRTLLVSAAAGSGKTATLTERIIVSMLDKDNPIGIDEMLIVTFTRAAVGELRERIGKALRDAIRQNPQDSYLEKQLYLLPSAKISTIDSFCASILRSNADRVSVNPDFRIADTAEAEMLSESILDGLISSIYEGNEPDVATPEELERLSESMTDTRSEGELSTVILSLYQSTLSSLSGVGSIGELVAEYDPATFTKVENTHLGGYAIKILHEAAEHYYEAFSKIRNELSLRGDKKLDKLISVIDSDLAFLSGVRSRKTYTGLREALLSYEFPRSVSVRDDTLPPTTALRAEMKDDIKTRIEECFFFTEEDWRVAYRSLYEILYTLVKILERFDGLFRSEKIRRGMLEYSDVERLTYECLYEGGELTDVALSERRLYKAVYIDEYQDVNSLQNKIFEAVSTDRNRFMVGDIKQSIYGFRSANTDIFASMKKEFLPIEKSEGSPTASIFMSNNFRCDRGVVDFVNNVFDSIFYRLRDSIGYLDGDRLAYSKMHEGGEPEYRYPEICIASTDELGEDDETNEREMSALVVASKIKELLDGATLDDGRPVAPGDIAIIMRNAKDREGVYKSALDSLGIRSAVADDTSFFLNSEVLLTLCLLNAIDNPKRDIYLAGLLVSPLYSFTPSELVAIRAEGGDTLYDSVISYTDTHSFEKGRKFLSEIERYRTLSEGMPTDELLSILFNSTGLLAIASERGSRENLLLLYENARRFEGGSYRGLYNFLTFINGVIDRKNAFDKREAPESDDSVKIITAHSSKGLEFPIVFFVGGEESFHRSRGAAPRFVYKEGFGIGLYARTPSGLGLVENPTKAIINEYIRRCSLEEEARVLYVALTRARERLFVVATPKKSKDAFLEEIAVKREYLSDYSVYSLSSFAEIILASGKFATLSANEFCRDELSLKDVSKRECATESEISEKTPDGVVGETLIERFKYEYPDKRRTMIPEKISVSKLYPRLFDDEGDGVFDVEAVLDGEREGSGYLPAFISGDTADSKAKGIATHLFLQFCDLDGLFMHGAREELRILTEKRFISERDAGLVRIKEAEMFRSSELFKKMRSASKIWRELRFNVKLPCEMFATELGVRESLVGERVLVQGVIDCLILDTEGNYHLVDYKTDRLTREELSDRSLAEKRLRESHSRQLGYYAEAVKIMFSKYPETVEVYSLPLGDTVDVKIERK